MERVMASPEIMTPAEAAKVLHMTPGTLASWRYADRGNLIAGKPIEGPPWIEINGRCKGYEKKSFFEWLRKQEIR